MFLSFEKIDGKIIYVDSKKLTAFESVPGAAQTILHVKGGECILVEEPTDMVFAQVKRAKGWRK